MELVVDDVDAARLGAPRLAKRMVSLRVERWELAVRQAVERAGGRWNPGGRVWEMGYDRAVELGLEDRIVDDGGP